MSNIYLSRGAAPVSRSITATEGENRQFSYTLFRDKNRGHERLSPVLVFEEIKHIRPKVAWIFGRVIVYLPVHANDGAIVFLTPLSYCRMGFGKLFVRPDMGNRRDSTAGCGRVYHFT